MNTSRHSNDMGSGLRWKRAVAIILALVSIGVLISFVSVDRPVMTPISRLFIQSSLNYVLHRGETPPVDLTGGYIQRSENDYIDGNVTVGYALTKKTDLQAQYFVYYSNNYADNSAIRVLYNTSVEEHGIVGTVIHKFSSAMQMTFKYGWTTYSDKLYSGRNDFEAHMLYSSFRYRF